MFFQIFAMTALALFYGCYFLKQLSQRRQGVQTNQVCKEKAGLTFWVEASMGIASLAAPAAELVSIGLNRWAGPTWLRAAGAAASLAGVALFYAAVLTMKDSWRAGVSQDETSLVTNGIFQWSRNPAFLGFDLVYLGLLAMFFNLPLCLISLFAVAAFHLQIVCNEEPAMARAFGPQYARYQQTVCRYWGRRAGADRHISR